MDYLHAYIVQSNIEYFRVSSRMQPRMRSRIQSRRKTFAIPNFFSPLSQLRRLPRRLSSLRLLARYLPLAIPNFYDPLQRMFIPPYIIQNQFHQPRIIPHVPYLIPGSISQLSQELPYCNCYDRLQQELPENLAHLLLCM